ncbi:unnamed protein product [Chondrus crispus]|uniref:Uncharacterized protein n=1 Tax=Chondrus crispus TaxID=2769 RepID=R7QMT7_CHOCR|nr:unnamed protein product [Chondrus crispus]CDF39068.1 unnamed protein product [Chondrus crispus]|eukprot:XP_005718979.1 unnamed protein product [Chondrus crispus]
MDPRPPRSYCSTLALKAISVVTGLSRSIPEPHAEHAAHISRSSLRNTWHQSPPLLPQHIQLFQLCTALHISEAESWRPPGGTPPNCVIGSHIESNFDSLLPFACTCSI